MAYQTSGSISALADWKTIEVKLQWQQTNNPSSNTSNIEWELILVKHSLPFPPKSRQWTVTIDGQETKGTTTFVSTVRGTVIGSGTTKVKHNPDGTKSLSLAFSVDVDAMGAFAPHIGAITSSGLVEIKPNESGALIVSAPNFTDEQNPTITYSIPIKEGITSLQACISFTGVKDDIKYRDIPQNKTEYTFSLTSAERDVLRKGVTTGATCQVRFYVRTSFSGDTYYSYVTKTMSLVNNEPSFKPTVKDTNERAVYLTGDSNKFIKYFSNAEFNTGAQGNKGATLASQYITNGSKTIENQYTGTFEAIESNTFYLGATDNRGISAKGFKTVDLIPYIPLTANLTIDSFTPNGELTFTVKGKYFNGNFGAHPNTMDIDYQYRKIGEDISEVFRLVNIHPMVDEQGDYSYSHTISGLDHLSAYSIELVVIDEVKNDGIKISSVAAPFPVFDWGKSDFVHHTNVYLDNNKTLRTNFTDGTDAQILGVNANNNLTIGWGGYDTGKGNSGLYGNNVLLVAKNKVTINGSTLADFVVEQASNGVWFYRKWNSGRVELYGYQNINSVACNTALGGWYRTAVQSAPAFPFTVFNPRVITNYESNGYGALVWATTNATTTKPYDYYLIRPTSSAAITGRTLFHVDGTWK